MVEREKFKLGLTVAGLLFLGGAGSVLLYAGEIHASRQMFGWLGSEVHRKIFPEQNAAGPTYDETAKGPVALADVISQSRAGWPSAGVATVHGVACEVASGLLHYGDIEVGTIEGGKFVPWSMKPWAAEEKIRTEVMAMSGFLTDGKRYVFRRKVTAN